MAVELVEDGAKEGFQEKVGTFEPLRDELSEILSLDPKVTRSMNELRKFTQGEWIEGYEKLNKEERAVIKGKGPAQKQIDCPSEYSYGFYTKFYEELGNNQTEIKEGQAIHNSLNHISTKVVYALGELEMINEEPVYSTLRDSKIMNKCDTFLGKYSELEKESLVGLDKRINHISAVIHFMITIIDELKQLKQTSGNIKTYNQVIKDKKELVKFLLELISVIEDVFKKAGINI